MVNTGNKQFTYPL